MNTQNLDYLKDNLKYLGFSEKLNPELEKNIQQGLPEFSLKMQNDYGKDKLEAQLHFKKSDQSEMYFFNRYDAKLTTEAGSQNQMFYIQKGNGVTMKEAYNLLSGRAVNKDLVNKEGQFYNAWMQVNFKENETNGNFKIRQYHQNYGFDLEKSLAAHPIKELTNEQSKERLMESLQRGNRQAVTFVKEGVEQKHFIEANPQFKSITVYDSNMQRVNARQQTGEKQDAPSQQAGKSESKTAGKKAGGDEDGPGIPESPKKRTRKQSQSL